ncbi:DUF859 family phage minor structural protein [Bacillus mojavensis]
MATSGSITQSVNSHWSLRLEWSASQNYDDNTSKVTAKLYWIADKYGATDTSATKTCSIYISGTNNSGSWNNRSAGYMASLSGGQKKLIHTYTRTLNHSSNGSCSVTLDAWFDAELRLSGTYYGRINLDAQSWSLNTIPRESKLNDSSPNWTAGSDITLSFTRYSSSFNHEIEIYLQDSSGSSTMPDGTKCTHLKQIVYSTSQTSKSTSFTVAEKYETFRKLNGSSSIKAWIRLQTFSGTKQIGSSQEYYATVTAPSASTTSVGNFTLGGTVSVPISRKDSEFIHKIDVSIGSWSKTLTSDATTSYSWSTSGDMNSIMGQISSTSKTGSLKFTITTYYPSGSSKSQVRSSTSKSVTVTIPSSQSPSFSGAVTWDDTGSVTVNGTTTTLNSIKGTGNEAIMIQGKSKLVVTLPSNSLGTAKTGTTMDRYTVTVNGYTKTVSHPSTATNLTFTFTPTELNVNSDQTMLVRAYDKRNMYTEVRKTIKFVAYSPPSIVITAFRNNGFGNDSTIGVRGSFSTVSIGGSNKNAMATTNPITYQYKVKGTSDNSYTTATPLEKGTDTFPSYSSVNKTDLSFDNTMAWTIKFTVTDKFGSYSATKDIQTGVPIMFIDSVMESVGIGKIPTQNKALEVAGAAYVKRLEIGENMYAPSAGGAGIDLNNSDIIGANSIFMNDTAQSSEGLHWVNSNTPFGSTNTADYDTFRVLDGIGYINATPVFDANEARILWMGASFPNSSTTIRPAKKLSECVNGWVLAWSDYDADAKRTNDYNIAYTFIPKSHVSIFNGCGVYVTIHATRTVVSSKYIYIHDDRIAGNDDNQQSDNYSNDIVLRYVLSC